MTVSPESESLLKNLADLKSIADAARLKYAQAAAQHKTNSLSVSKLHADMKQARDAWTQAYKAAGITRQRAWQLSRMAAGKCRTCGKTSATTNCPKCREKMRKAYAKRGEKRFKQGSSKKERGFRHKSICLEEKEWEKNYASKRDPKN